MVQLIDLANQRGGSDNITVAVAQVDALDWDARPITEEDLAADRERITIELPIDDDRAGAAGRASRDHRST